MLLESNIWHVILEVCKFKNPHYDHFYGVEIVLPQIWAGCGGGVGGVDGEGMCVLLFIYSHSIT